MNALKTEYQKYPIDLQPEKVHSAASIAKAYLGMMGLTRPAAKYAVADKIHGIAMQAYYGGRAECRIRNTIVPVVLCDFTSEYPTVNCLLGMWPQFVAKSVKVKDFTKEARSFIQSVTLDRLFELLAWPNLAFFALIQPDSDVLPVRTQYSDSGETNIGLNPFTSKEPVWYAGPDLAASVLLSQRRPKIIKAIKLVPAGTQKGLTPTVLGDRAINPAHDNFFRAVIENRQTLASDDPQNYFLKILANAGGYGMYAELNRVQFGKNSPKQLHVYSGEEYRQRQATSIEVAGPWYFPPVASLITAGGRLLLAMLEKAVTDAGGTYLMCDTDSMAIVATEPGGLVACNGGTHGNPSGEDSVKALPWHEVKSIAERFAQLNPYDKSLVPDILKVENYNYDRQGKQRQVNGFGISAKRYALFTGDDTIIKPSEHGLGPYFHPNKRRYRPHDCKNQKDSYPEWMVQGWRWILQNHQGRDLRSPKWFNLLAMRKIAITTPNVLGSLRRIDRDSAKPYNFVISPLPLFGGPMLVGPFSDDPRRWAGIEDGPDYVSVEDGARFRLCKPEEDEILIWNPDFAARKNSKTTKYLLSAQLRDLEQVFRDYVQHPESKSLAPDGSPCVANTRGLLLRRPIRGFAPFRLIGKEVDRSAQDDYAVVSDITPLEYGSPQGVKANAPLSDNRAIAELLEEKLKAVPIKELARQTGIDRNTIRRVLRGERVHAKTRLKLTSVLSREQ